MIASHSLGKTFYPIYFCLYAIFCRLDSLACLSGEFIHKEYGFSINLKIQLMSSTDKSVLTMKISNFCRLQNFADFDIKIVLLSQNIFEGIAFC